MSPWEPQASPEQIGRLEEARNGAQAHAGHIEHTCGRDSSAARWANHQTREAGRELYAATHPQWTTPGARRADDRNGGRTVIVDGTHGLTQEERDMARQFAERTGQSVLILEVKAEPAEAENEAGG